MPIDSTAYGQADILSRLRYRAAPLAQFPRWTQPWGPPGARRYAGQYGSQLTRQPWAGGRWLCAVPGLREGLRFEERAGGRAPEQPHCGEADQPRQHGGDQADEPGARPTDAATACNDK